MAVSDNDRLEIVRMKEKEPATLEERITRLEDKETIRDLLMQYSHLCDANDWEGVLALYTDDVERVLGGTLEETVKGKDVLRDKYINPSLKRKGDDAKISFIPVDKVYHLGTTLVVRISDDGKTAWSTSYFSLVSTKETDGEFAKGSHEGTHIFTYVKQGNTWKIKKMIVITDLAYDPLFAPFYKKMKKK